MENENIKEFRENFNKIYQEQVIPAIKNLDGERKKIYSSIDKISYKVYICLGILLGIYTIFAIFVFHKLNIDIYIKIPIAAVAIIECIKFIRKKQFENQIKSKIMPLLMPAFKGFEWTQKQIISDPEIRCSKLFATYAQQVTDDNFIGKYKGMPVRISEIILSKNNASGSTNEKYELPNNVPDKVNDIIKVLDPNLINLYEAEHNKFSFDGVIVAINIPKRFKGHTIILPKKEKRSSHQEVKLEDVEFNKQFNIYSTDQVEARYLLTPAFMQRFKNIQNIFGADTLSCSFLDNVLMIAIPTNKDLFSLGDLNSSVVDASQFNTFLNELISIFELIDELKLCDNTGL